MGEQGNTRDVYDFDGTIYDGDSTVDFVLYCLRRFPGTWLTLPRTAVAAVQFGLKILPKTQFKQTMYRFLQHVPQVEDVVVDFWLEHCDKMVPCVNPQPGDLVISASPEFLLKPYCDIAGYELMASVVDPHTGQYTGQNCHGQEKIRRLRERYPDVVVRNFYSDSRNDDPMARLAQHAYFVRKEQLDPWPNN